MGNFISSIPLMRYMYLSGKIPFLSRPLAPVRAQIVTIIIKNTIQVKHSKLNFKFLRVTNPEI